MFIPSFFERSKNEAKNRRGERSFLHATASIAFSEALSPRTPFSASLIIQ